MFICLCIGLVPTVYAQQQSSYTNLVNLKIPGKVVVVTTAELIPTRPAPDVPRMPSIKMALLEYCCVDGIINRRPDVDGKEYGIGFALALP